SPTSRPAGRAGRTPRRRSGGSPPTSAASSIGTAVHSNPRQPPRSRPWQPARRPGSASTGGRRTSSRPTTPTPPLSRTSRRRPRAEHHAMTDAAGADPTRSLRATFRGIGSVVAPTSAVTALLYYFGWTRTSVEATQLGL